MDLSKTYNYLPYDLLLAKLVGCGFDKQLLSLILYYLTDRGQCTKIRCAKRNNFRPVTI